MYRVDVAVKRTVKMLAPVWYERATREYRYRCKYGPAARHLHAAMSARCANIVSSLAAPGGWVVQSGPFQGLKYPPAVVRIQRQGHIWGSALAPKLLGSYEAELHEVLEYIVAQPYQTVIDVGTGEGYYAVGLACRLPSASIHGFEISPGARRFCAELAALNAVGGRIHLAGAAEPSVLRPLLTRGRTLMVSDCEGYERTLLDPQELPELAFADILVELHEHLQPGITSLLRERFSGTHVFYLIEQQPRDERAYPALATLGTRDDRVLALDEGRPAHMTWAWMISK